MTLPRCAVCGLPEAAIARRNWTLDVLDVRDARGAVGTIRLCTDCRRRAIERPIGGVVPTPALVKPFGPG